ncbi:hypothetical protein [Emticicia fontis]
MKKTLFTLVFLLPALVQAQTYSSIEPGSTLFTNNTPSGIVGSFMIFHPFNSSYALAGSTDGTGGAIFAGITNTLNPANALNASTFGTGGAGRFQILNTVNNGIVLEASTNGKGGTVGYFKIDNESNTGTILTGTSNGLGIGNLFILTNPQNDRDGFSMEHKGVGDAINGYNTGMGRAAYFVVTNANNSKPAVYCTTAGIGATLVANHTGQSGNIAVFQSSLTNVARIDKTGKGFFNGGTQNSGADIAEAFDVIGTTNAYEAGDVLVIATSKKRAVEKSSKSYSTLVAGVYATKPGVLLTEENIDTDISDKVPMGVVGVIPTKVCNEGGKIHIGDMLVTSSRTGYAMKGNPKKIKIGQVIGKALEDFNGQTGKINVLVSVR